MLFPSIEMMTGVLKMLFTFIEMMNRVIHITAYTAMRDLFNIIDNFGTPSK